MTRFASADPHDAPLALSFDDVLLVPQHSQVLPTAVDVATRLGRLPLPLPVLSAAMDTVTESRLAIAMAGLGGLGVVHKNLSPERQAEEVRAVKAAAVPDASTATPAVDGEGRLRVAAALGASADRRERLALLREAEVDCLVVDSAHGHSQGILEAVKATREAWPEATIVAGNVATEEATLALIEAGADVVKVGIGPGSICTTRVVAGVGVPQLSAVWNCARAAAERSVPVIADGGIRASGDIVKALAAGAAAVMLGGLLAASDEAPGELVTIEGRRFKRYRGMGSAGAMQAGSADRYFQNRTGGKLVPEGVEGRVPARGPLGEILHQLVGGVRAGMGYVGAPDLARLRSQARFVRVTPAGDRESRVHDILPDA